MILSKIYLIPPVISPELHSILLIASIAIIIIALAFAAFILIKWGALSRRPSQAWRRANPYGPIATFDVDHLVISPSQAERNEEVIVSCVVTNSSLVIDCYTAELKVNGVIVATKDITLAPGAKELVSFTLFESLPGDYEVEIAGLRGKFTIS